MARPVVSTFGAMLRERGRARPTTPCPKPHHLLALALALGPSSSLALPPTKLTDVMRRRSRVRRLVASLGTALSNLVAIAAPEGCAACDESTSVGSLFCAVCERLALPLPEGATLSDGKPVVALGTYGGPLREAIRHFKYGNRPDLARPFGERLASALGSSILPPDTVFVPVPLHRKRLAERGYNQSALVAAVVAGRLGQKMTARALVRTRATAEQANLLRADRLRNVAGAFKTLATFHGRSVVVVDDVVTTGATVNACIRALENAQNRVIAVAALGLRTRDEPALEKHG